MTALSGLMRRGWWASLVFCCASSAFADQFDLVREVVRDQMAVGNVPSVAVAVVQDGKIVWQEGFGWADKAKKIPATADTVYSLASISKPFTATALMMLVERGRIDLDKPINDYLGASKLVAQVGDVREATVRRVANHTSGLPTYWQFYYEDRGPSRPAMEQSIARQGRLLAAPGEVFVYSNFGYGVLEYAIERRSGRSYAKFLRDEIFQPLGMRHSAVNREPDFGAQVAVRYAVDGTVIPFYDFDHRGASAVFASAHDLAQFALAHLKTPLPAQKRILSDASIDAMAQPGEGAAAAYYGLGWQFRPRYGLRTYGHTGDMGGVATRLALFPDQRLGIVVLSNSENKITRIIEQSIVNTLLPETIVASRREFKPEAGWIGSWQGAVVADEARTEIRLDIDARGRVFARVGSAPRTEVILVQVVDGQLQLDEVPGDLGTEVAARYPYRLSFSLKPRGEVMNGAVTAVSRPLADRVGSGVSYWTELKRVDAAR
ncbi:serine hydrolase domain-containing protein [Steroidobacter sp.]|uniref:serine hydrolase domain-containing protein n=1 Tax=Steroidobacter sp. TaxID=1978227 RepID=UPI001A52912B|nr:serine hydrolase domain-containing protein [Steroidobacter sp.]MBL8271630.1 beta-lactamase family protein [Steroidobacter sp.]